jgi:hypothetical protein
MSIETRVSKQAVHGMLDAKIKTVESKFESLQARAQAAKATAEIKAIAELATRKIQLRMKLEELRNLGDGKWEQAKKHVESMVAKFEKDLKDIEAKAQAH